MTARAAICWHIAFLLTAPLFVVRDAAHASERDSAVAKHIEEGQFREAYEESLREGKGQPDQLAHLARIVLDAGLKSPDSYPRWFSLRAARTVDDPALAASARRLADSGDRYIRSLALEILANIDPEGSRQDFLAALDSPFRTVRLRALAGLELLRDPSLIQSFANTLRNDPDPDLRALASRALGTTGSRNAIPVLREALEDPAATVQSEAVKSLVLLKDPRISELLRQRLAGASPKDRVRIVRLAALVPDAGLLEALGPFLGESDAETRAFAAAAVLSITNRSVQQQP